MSPETKRQYRIRLHRLQLLAKKGRLEREADRLQGFVEQAEREGQTENQHFGALICELSYVMSCVTGIELELEFLR